MTRPTSRIVLTIALAAMAACKASFPTAPATLTAVVVRYPLSGTQLIPGALERFEAYTVDSDGVYAQVTEQATWSSSNPAAASIDSFLKWVASRAAGSAEIRATYQGVVGMLPIEVRATSFPRLRISIAGGVSSPSMFADLQTSPSMNGQPVTTGLTWSSSNPAIAEVKSGLLIKGLPGNVEIRASYNGVSGSFWISVPPRAGNLPR